MDRKYLINDHSACWNRQRVIPTLLTFFLLTGCKSAQNSSVVLDAAYRWRTNNTITISVANISHSPCLLHVPTDDGLDWTLSYSDEQGKFYVVSYDVPPIPFDGVFIPFRGNHLPEGLIRDDAMLSRTINLPENCSKIESLTLDLEYIPLSKLHPAKHMWDLTDALVHTNLECRPLSPPTRNSASANTISP